MNPLSSECDEGGHRWLSPVVAAFGVLGLGVLGLGFGLARVGLFHTVIKNLDMLLHRVLLDRAEDRRRLGVDEGDCVHAACVARWR